MIRGEQAGATVESRLQAAFREIGYEDENERKVCKVMGKLHDGIRRVLSDQRSAIQTHEALPIVHTSALPTAAKRSPSAFWPGMSPSSTNSVFYDTSAGAGSYRRHTSKSNISGSKTRRTIGAHPAAAEVRYS